MRVLELFSGYGSQALALENIGIDFKSDISEIDKYAIQAYNQLHGKTHNWGDICKIDEKQLPYYDLITYSSPCQDFSVAGLGRGGDAGSGTRSSLLWECERIIRAVKPKYLLMENVKNLVGEKHKHNFIKWLNVLESIGYQSWYKILNAKDYGVPQNRERVFVVSILGGGQYLFPNPIKLQKRLKDVLEKEVDEKYYISKDFEKYIKQKEEKPYGFNVEVTEENQIRKNPLRARGDIPCVRVPNATKTGYDKAYIGDSINLDQPNSKTRRGRVGHGMANTLTTSCMQAVVEPLACASRGRNPNNPSDRTPGVPTKQRLEIKTDGCSNTLTTVEKDNYVLQPNTYSNGYRIRKLTPRECWRLMGVKDNQYNKLHDISNRQLYKMAGNSIVVDVLMGIFRNLLQSDEGTKGQLTLL